jgi:ketosteroid isomerase-like protein
MALAAVAVAGCGESVPTDVAAAKVEVEAAIKKWHEHYDKGEVDQLEGMLDPEVSLPSPPEEFLHGREAVFARIKKEVEEYVISRDVQGKRKTRFGTIRITISGLLAVATYDVTVSDPTGTSISALFTRVLRKSGGAWLILSEHYTFGIPPKPQQPPPPK